MAVNVLHKAPNSVDSSGPILVHVLFIVERELNSDSLNQKRVIT